MATHSSILAWRIPMDRGGWWATVNGVARVGHNWATKHKDVSRTSESGFLSKNCIKHGSSNPCCHLLCGIIQPTSKAPAACGYQSSSQALHVCSQTQFAWSMTFPHSFYFLPGMKLEPGPWQLTIQLGSCPPWAASSQWRGSEEALVLGDSCWTWNLEQVTCASGLFDDLAHHSQNYTMVRSSSYPTLPSLSPYTGVRLLCGLRALPVHSYFCCCLVNKSCPTLLWPYGL